MKSNIKDWISFFRATCISWGLLNLFMLLVAVLIMWIEGMKGYMFSVLFGLFSIIYLVAVSTIIKNIRLEPILIWKLLTIGFLSFVIYQNIDFIVTVFLNQGRYPCNLGANCP